MLRTVPELIAEVRADLRLLDAHAAMLEVADNNGTVIDVREPKEALEKPAMASVNVPRGVLEMLVTEKIKDADHPIYLHCASGVRATLAAEQLKRIGYTNVTAISCPIDSVREAQES